MKNYGRSVRKDRQEEFKLPVKPADEESDSELPATEANFLSRVA